MAEALSQAVILVPERGAQPGERPGERSASRATPDAGGLPFLDGLIGEVARFGLKRITLLAVEPDQAILQRYHAQAVRGARLEVLVGPAAHGTAGRLRQWVSHLDDRFLLLDGAKRFDINLLDLALHEAGALATLALRRARAGDSTGMLEMDCAGLIRGLAPPLAGHAGVLPGGVALLRREVIAEMGDGVASLEQEILPRLAARGLLRGRLYDGTFLEMLQPEQTAVTRAMDRRPAAFLDRDGVLIEDTGWPHQPAQARWIQGAMSAVKRLNDSGYYVFVVTNQAGVAKDFYPEAQIGVMHDWMAGELARAGAHVDAWEYCPHHPDAPLARYRLDCPRRKPRPGMILDLLAAWPVDSARSFLVGDRETDVAAARAAGIAAHLFPGGDLSAFLDQKAAEATALRRNDGGARSIRPGPG